ncbi:MAG: hypothetical protein PF961_21060 [Planctomycetota bacterium]|jgi:hypothetical protein|nr:hypothetical protein [Planctomycetota bacterium]
MKATAVLERIAELAQRQEPLAPGLRDCGIPGAERVAERLDAGASVSDALAGLCDVRTRHLLGGEGGSLAEKALLAATELRLRVEGRYQAVAALAYPLSCVLAMVVAAIVVAVNFGLGYGAPWMLAAVPAAALVALAVVPLPRLPMLRPLSAWRVHARSAARFARAELAARWQLNEERIHTLFGNELDSVLPTLAMDGAAERCADLADWHRDAALRSARRSAQLIALACYFAAAGLAIVTGYGLYQELVTVMDSAMLEAGFG